MQDRFREVDTKSPATVRAEVTAIYVRLFPNVDPEFIHSIFTWTEDVFAGRNGNYQGNDAKYHDLEHTLQGTLCFARLLEGYLVAGAEPRLSRRMFELGLVAILLHDTGYLKRREDTEGTGAKYTLVHVGRSTDFAAWLLPGKGFSESEVRSVQNMIRCTGVNVDLKSIPFQSELERRMGYGLGTADLLGQMAARDYVEKLGILYQEFEESYRFNGKATGAGMFSSADDLRRRTPDFWLKYVLPKINNDFLGEYRYLSRPDPAGINQYVEGVQANIRRLQAQLQPAHVPSREILRD